MHMCDVLMLVYFNNILLLYNIHFLLNGALFAYVTTQLAHSFLRWQAISTSFHYSILVIATFKWVGNIFIVALFLQDLAIHLTIDEVNFDLALKLSESHSLPVARLCTKLATRMGIAVCVKFDASKEFLLVLLLLFNMAGYIIEKCAIDISEMNYH
ncbi:hypothetical protein ACJX0J_030459, partial [Zea mays]